MLRRQDSADCQGCPRPARLSRSSCGADVDLQIERRPPGQEVVAIACTPLNSWTS
jgi:hypothetical protein